MVGYICATIVAAVRDKILAQSDMILIHNHTGIGLPL
jgi:hypothetical protein